MDYSKTNKIYGWFENYNVIKIKVPVISLGTHKVDKSMLETVCLIEVSKGEYQLGYPIDLSHFYYCNNEEWDKNKERNIVFKVISIKEGYATVSLIVPVIDEDEEEDNDDWDEEDWDEEETSELENCFNDIAYNYGVNVGGLTILSVNSEGKLNIVDVTVNLTGNDDDMDISFTPMKNKFKLVGEYKMASGNE